MVKRTGREADHFHLLLSLSLAVLHSLLLPVRREHIKVYYCFTPLADRNTLLNTLDTSAPSVKHMHNFIFTWNVRDRKHDHLPAGRVISEMICYSCAGLCPCNDLCPWSRIWKCNRPSNSPPSFTSFYVRVLYQSGYFSVQQTGNVDIAVVLTPSFLVQTFPSSEYERLIMRLTLQNVCKNNVCRNITNGFRSFLFYCVVNLFGLYHIR